MVKKGKIAKAPQKVKKVCHHIFCKIFIISSLTIFATLCFGIYNKHSHPDTCLKNAIYQTRNEQNLIKSDIEEVKRHIEAVNKKVDVLSKIVAARKE